MNETNFFIKFCSSPIVIFLGTTLCSHIFFQFATNLFREERFPGKTKAFCIGFNIFNGIVSLPIVYLLYGYLNLAVNICIAVIVLFIQFCIILKDRLQPILFLMSAATFIITMGYNTAIIILGVLQNQPYLIENHQNYLFIYSLGALSTTVYLYFILFAKIFELPNFRSLTHSVRNKFLFIFFVVFDVVSLLTILFFHPLLYQPFVLSMNGWYFVLFTLTIKELITFSTIFFILHAQSGLERAHHEGETLQSELLREKRLRAMNKKGTFFEYAVNITKDTFIYGQENLRTTYGIPEKYSEAIKYFVKTFVHPDDVGLLGGIGDLDAYRMKLTVTPTYSAIVRLSSQKIKEYLRPSEDVACHMATVTHEWFYNSFIGALIVDDNTGDLLLYVDVMDVDEKTRREHDLLSSATQDSLTKVLNRSAIETRIDRVLSAQNKNCVMFLFDRDNFKTINDTFGHPEGDVLLKETADILNSEFRDLDLVGRLGGDEFIVFAFGLSSREVITRKAEALLSKLTKDYKHGNQIIKTSVSIGIALYPQDGVTYIDLYKRADQALYAAKKNSKNTYCFYEDIKSSAIIS